MSDNHNDYVPWIDEFCSLPGHEFFIPVSQDFIEDDFNLAGLSLQVPYYKDALFTILDYKVETENECVQSETDDTLTKLNDKKNKILNNNNRISSSKSPPKIILSNSAELLYGLLHARYIISKQGLTTMASKFEQGNFGTCPRYYCSGMHLIPMGPNDMPGQETLKLYCPFCNDIYVPPNSTHLNIDGAFFGTTFPSLLIKMFPEIENQCKKRINKINQNDTSLRLYGFKISELSISGPRMKWLRSYPTTKKEKKNFEKCTFKIPTSESSDED